MTLGSKIYNEFSRLLLLYPPLTRLHEHGTPEPRGKGLSLARTGCAKPDPHIQSYGRNSDVHLHLQYTLSPLSPSKLLLLVRFNSTSPPGKRLLLFVFL